MTKFDIYFNLNAEDTYLVQNISQYMRNNGYSTFDRSVDRLPVTDEENLSEDDALDASREFVYILTENSVKDPFTQQMAIRAKEVSKPITLIRFDNAEPPVEMREFTVLEGDRANLAPMLKNLLEQVRRA